MLLAARCVLPLSLLLAANLPAQSPAGRGGPAFVYRADFPLDGHASLFAELNEIQSELVRLLLLPPAREPVNVVLFRDEATYRAFGRRYFASVPYRRALFVKASGPGTVYAFRGPELAEDLRHEATHGLLHATLPMVPLWLDEGLAEYFEVPAAERAGGNPHHKTVTWNLRLGRVPSLARLETRRDVSEMSASDYRDAWAWVHFMLHGPFEARGELVRFLSDVRAGAAPGQLSRRLQARLPGAEQRLAEHFRAWPR